jgi:hypothetical protein
MNSNIDVIYDDNSDITSSADNIINIDLDAESNIFLDKLLINEMDQIISENDSINETDQIISEYNLINETDRIIFENDSINETDQTVSENNLTTDIENLNDIDDQTKEQISKRKRGLPKTILIGQQKHLKALEKQHKMSGKSKPKNKTTSKIESKELTPQIIDTTQMRRVIIGGQVKYLPIVKKESKIEQEIKITIPTIKKTSVVRDKKVINNNTTVPDNDLKKSNNSRIKKQVSVKKNKLPKKYAYKVEQDIKKQTMKNVKNFSDLCKIKAIENLDSNIDTTRASMIELRKLKIEQRKREQDAAKKKIDANKRDSMVQAILNNDKMTKFSKTVAIKNMSVNSRNKKISKTLNAVN